MRIANKLAGDENEPVNIKVQLTDSSGTPANTGNGFYAVKRDNVGTSSINIPFGFTSKMVIVETSMANSDDVCVDWLGGTAIVPAANISGDDLLSPGRIVVLDNFYTASISLIAVSGTQTVYVRAFK